MSLWNVFRNNLWYEICPSLCFIINIFQNWRTSGHSKTINDSSKKKFQSFLLLVGNNINYSSSFILLFHSQSYHHISWQPYHIIGVFVVLIDLYGIFFHQSICIQSELDLQLKIECLNFEFCCGSTEWLHSHVWVLWTDWILLLP